MSTKKQSRRAVAHATIETDMNMVGPMYTALALYPATRAARGPGGERLAFRWRVVEVPGEGPIAPRPLRPALGGATLEAAQRAIERRYGAAHWRLRTSWRDGGEAALHWRLYEDGTVD